MKNNLQTIASLLRIQARRSDSDEVRRALAEATERAGSMAVVHDLLADSDRRARRLRRGRAPRRGPGAQQRASARTRASRSA